MLISQRRRGKNAIPVNCDEDNEPDLSRVHGNRNLLKGVEEIAAIVTAQLKSQMNWFHLPDYAVPSYRATKEVWVVAEEAHGGWDGEDELEDVEHGQRLQEQPQSNQQSRQDGDGRLGWRRS